MALGTGSSYYVDEGNALMYAGTKTYLGGHSVISTGNLLLWPNVNGWGAATMCYASAANSSGFDEHWTNNTVVLGPSGRGSASRGSGYTDYASCELSNPQDPPTPLTANNTIYVPGAVSNFTTRCSGTPSNPHKTPVPFSAWQASGRDAGSTVAPGRPVDSQLVAQARRLLGMTDQ